jgi:hypothetical protein
LPGGVGAIRKAPQRFFSIGRDPFPPQLKEICMATTVEYYLTD